LKSENCLEGERRDAQQAKQILKQIDFYNFLNVDYSDTYQAYTWCASK